MAASEHHGGEATQAESRLNLLVSKYIHLFLSALAVLIMVAATIAVVEMLYRAYPALWQPGNEYQVLHQLLQDILLVAIAAELGLLLLYHRASAALEVVLFVIARRMVATDVTALDLLFGSVALAVLLAVRFYFLPGRPE